MCEGVKLHFNKILVKPLLEQAAQFSSPHFAKVNGKSEAIERHVTKLIFLRSRNYERKLLRKDIFPWTNSIVILFVNMYKCCVHQFVLIQFPPPGLRVTP